MSDDQRILDGVSGSLTMSRSLAPTSADCHGVRTQTFTIGDKEHQIRIIGTDEDPWFVAADIGKVLGIQKMSHHLPNYKEGSERGVGEVDTPSGVQKMIILSEMAVDRFLMRSQKKEAEPFQEWVASVLKTIRLAGRYEVPLAYQEPFRMRLANR